MLWCPLKAWLTSFECTRDAFPFQHISTKGQVCSNNFLDGKYRAFLQSSGSLVWSTLICVDMYIWANHLEKCIFVNFKDQWTIMNYKLVSCWTSLAGANFNFQKYCKYCEKLYKLNILNGILHRKVKREIF